MENVKRAAAVLQQAEENLRSLVSESAASGDYVSVVQIAAWARTVSELVQQAPGNPTSAVSRSSHSQPKSISPAAARGKLRPVGEEYPKFFRQGNQLIRVAWSKKEKREYQHKAPYVVLQTLAKTMSDVGTDGRVFSTEQFLPLHDPEGGEVPAYQAYVGIALFKQTALIDQHGRQGYSIPRLAEFKDAVESVWTKLPKL